MSDNRNQSIDAFKLLAAVCVILIHFTPSSRAAAYFSDAMNKWVVPFFLIVSMVFFVRKQITKIDVTKKIHRFDRIIIPYLIWSSFYLIMRICKASITGESFQINYLGILLFGQSAAHLYFLPLLLVCQFLAIAFLRFSITRKIDVHVISFLLLGSAIGLLGHFGGYLFFDHAVERCLFYFTGALILAKSTNSPSMKWINLSIAILAVAYVFIPQIEEQLPATAIPFLRILVGYGIAYLAFSCNFKISQPAFRYVLTCSYGIFLSHIVFIEIIEFIEPKLWHTSSMYSLIGKITRSCMVTLFCLVLIRIARKIPLLAYSLFGEGDLKFFLHSNSKVN